MWNGNQNSENGVGTFLRFHDWALVLDPVARALLVVVKATGLEAPDVAFQHSHFVRVTSIVLHHHREKHATLLSVSPSPCLLLYLPSLPLTSLPPPHLPPSPSPPSLPRTSLLPPSLSPPSLPLTSPSPPSPLPLSPPHLPLPSLSLPPPSHLPPPHLPLTPSSLSPPSLSLPPPSHLPPSLPLTSLPLTSLPLTSLSLTPSSLSPPSLPPSHLPPSHSLLPPSFPLTPSPPLPHLGFLQVFHHSLDERCIVSTNHRDGAVLVAMVSQY